MRLDKEKGKERVYKREGVPYATTTILIIPVPNNVLFLFAVPVSFKAMHDDDARVMA